MTKPGISIVIPAYNEEKFLPATLLAAKAAQENLASSLGVTSEVIIVNNVSTDRTKEVAISHGAVVIDHPVRNISSVRNAGIKQASYSLIVAIDADSFLPPDGLVKVWRVMQEGPYIGGAFGVKVLTDKVFVKIAAFVIQTGVSWISGIQGAMFFFWREDALSFGGFSEKHLVAEDSIFANALRGHGKSAGKKFLLLKSVKVGTLDRKELPLREILPTMIKVFKAFRNAEQTTDDLKFWYDPKR